MDSSFDQPLAGPVVLPDADPDPASDARPDADFTVSSTLTDPGFSNGSLWGVYGDETTPRNIYGSHAAEAWAQGHVGSTSVVIGVVDTGVDVTHPDLYLNIWLNQMEIPFDLKQFLIDTDGDQLITFRDLNTAVNAQFVIDGNANGRIDGMDLLGDPRWADGVDTAGNGYVDDLIGWDFWRNTNRPYTPADIDRHGTHVAGTIAAIGGNGVGGIGVAPMAQVMVLKFMGPSGGYQSGAVAALDYFTWFAAHDTGQDYVATNNSWGGGAWSADVQAAIGRGALADVLFIVAAGNSSANNDAAPAWPANYSTLAVAGYEAVVSVAALTNTGSLAWFSNYGGSTVDIAAPGQGIISTTPGGGYTSLSGTSMAAPHVAGAIALFAAANPQATAADIRAALLQSATATPGLLGRVETDGRLDIAAMLETLADAPPAVIGMVLAQGALKAGEATTLTISFNRPVVLEADAFDLTAAQGTLTGLTTANGGATWTATFTPLAGVETAAAIIRLAEGGYIDDQGRSGPGASSPALSIDTRAPDVAIAVTVQPDGLRLNLSFSEPVTAFDAGSLHSTASGQLQSFGLGADGRSWSAIFVPDAGQTGSATFSVSAGGYQDTAGNSGSSAISETVLLSPPAPTGVFLLGSSGSDYLAGTAQDDVLLGVAQEDAALGRHTADHLQGGDGADIFIVGDTRGSFYDDAFQDRVGMRDLAWITDFSAADGDRIRIGPDVHLLQTAMLGTVSGVLIRLDSDGSGGLSRGDEVVAFVQGATLQTLGHGDLITALPDNHPAFATVVRPLSVDIAPTSAAEDAGHMTVTLTLDGPASGTEVVRLSVSGPGLNGVDGADFVGGALPVLTLSFAPGQTTATVTLHLTPDTAFEADERLRVTASAQSGFSCEEVSATALILNDDMRAGPAVFLTGTAAADSLRGQDWQAEVIRGVDPAAGTGRGTVDWMRGGLGADTFVLGGPAGRFYDDGDATSQGRSDLARIADFGADDLLLLAGQRQEYHLAAIGPAHRPGTGLFHDSNGNGTFDPNDEMIAILIGVTPADVADRNFAFLTL